MPSAPLFPVAADGMSEAQCALIGTHRLGVGPFGIALSENRRVVVSDAWSRSRICRPCRTRSASVRSRSCRCIGIEGQMVGALALMYRHSREASRRMLKLIEATAAPRGARGLARPPGRRCRARASQCGIGRAGESAVRRPNESRAAHAAPVDRGLHRFVGIQSADPLTPAQQRLLKRVRDNEELLVHVIDDLITFSRLEVGHITYTTGPVLACDALRAAEAVVAPLAIASGRIAEITGCQPDATIHADGDKVKQILVNLAANAVKFTGRDGAVRLSCRVDPTTVSFDVEDTGPGIPADRLGDIFEPYVQLGAPLHDRYGGTGLGLAISHEFATGMRGSSRSRARSDGDRCLHFSCRASSARRHWLRSRRHGRSSDPHDAAR